MGNSMEIRKQLFRDWAKDNLGEKTGIWYTPYLEKLGLLLSKFELSNSYFENFFTTRHMMSLKKYIRRLLEIRTVHY